jgi:hypothetical protein
MAREHPARPEQTGHQGFAEGQARPKKRRRVFPQFSLGQETKSRADEETMPRFSRGQESGELEEDQLMERGFSHRQLS